MPCRSAITFYMGKSFILDPSQVWRDVGKMEEEEEEGGLFWGMEMGLGCINFFFNFFLCVVVVAVK